MCVIMVKESNVKFPEENILQNCWDNNPDMGGFMFTVNNTVHIKKGYKTYEAFKKALDSTREMYGDDIPYVLHFRISTQGYNTSCCQPFPLSSKMKALKKSHTKCNVGVAHNGVLQLTSDGGLDYSDTMKFITDYLVNIIQDLSWHNNNRTKLLIENLIEGSRFAILDKAGKCTRLGKGWIEESQGLYFSNSSYSYKKCTYTSKYTPYYYDDYADWYDSFEWGANYKSTSDSDKWRHFKNANGTYDFDEFYCPFSEESDDSYCDKCLNQCDCRYYASWFEIINKKK